ncbi:hypothetical protein IAU59_002630 [Kwoniella sp. CBS 9459]
MPDPSSPINPPAVPRVPLSYNNAAKYNLIIFESEGNRESGRTRFDEILAQAVLERIEPPSRNLDQGSKSASSSSSSSPSETASPDHQLDKLKYTSSFHKWRRTALSKGHGKDDPADTLLFTITDDRHLGQLWDIYGGRLSRADAPEDSGIPVVLKLMRPSTFPDKPGYDWDGRPDFWFDVERKHTCSSAKEGAIREDWIYRSRLQSLYGVVVPHFLGVFRVATCRAGDDDEDEHIYAMILEDAGDPPELIECTWLMPLEIRKNICDAYRSLNETRVVHNSLDLRHVLVRRSPRHTVSLVDFSRGACLRDGFSIDRKERFAKKLAAEPESIAEVLCLTDTDE